MGLREVAEGGAQERPRKTKFGCSWADASGRRPASSPQNTADLQGLGQESGWKGAGRWRCGGEKHTLKRNTYIIVIVCTHVLKHRAPPLDCVFRTDHIFSIVKTNHTFATLRMTMLESINLILSVVVHDMFAPPALLRYIPFIH